MQSALINTSNDSTMFIVLSLLVLLRADCMNDYLSFKRYLIL